jgi:hypothetical protein
VLAPRGAPYRDERADRRIERAVGDARNVECGSQHVIQLGADRHAFARPKLETTELAVGTIVAHHFVERLDASERRTCRIERGSFVRSVEHEPHRHSHVDLGVLERARRWLEASRREQQQQNQRWLHTSLSS